MVVPGLIRAATQGRAPMPRSIIADDIAAAEPSSPRTVLCFSMLRL